MARLFDDDELALLSRSPRQQAEDAIAAGDAEHLEWLVSAWERRFRGTVRGTRNWVAHTFGFAAQHDDGEMLAALVDATRDFYAVFPDALAPELPTVPSVTAQVVELAARGATDDALEQFDAMYEQWCDAQDSFRDWLSALLSRIYHEQGIDTLELALRYTAERTLFSWMPTDIARPPQERLPSWARMLQGEFATVRIEEDDEKFTLVMDPCGTCTRQIQQGRYAAPLDLAVIEEEHAATWFRGHTPVYRAHVPLWHVALAGELLGVPWPVNQCPAGLGTGPCRVLLFKDPLDPAAHDQVPR